MSWCDLGLVRADDIKRLLEMLLHGQTQLKVFSVVDGKHHGVVCTFFFIAIVVLHDIIRYRCITIR